jgi:hypothetical protein
LFGCSMRGLIFISQSSIAPEQAMNMPRFRGWNMTKREAARMKIAALPGSACFRNLACRAITGGRSGHAVCLACADG